MEPLPLPDQFRAFAQSAERDGAATYGAICRHVAEDPELLGLIELAPPAQRRPNLLLAAVHFLLLGGAQHRLASYYDTVACVRHEAFAPPEGDVGVDFRDFCLGHREPLLDLIATRNTQTNEVGRCAALLPALCVIAEQGHTGLPLALLDLGTSGGLNLLFDSYRYRYHQRTDGSVTEAGEADAEVVLECTVRSRLSELPSLEPPPISSRTGIDAEPIDATSEDDARWLLACQWPDHLSRFSRLRAALAVAATSTHRPRMFQGDIVDQLADVAATIDDGAPLVVFHSWVAAYLTTDRQRELVDAVLALRQSWTVHYLYAESPVETAGLPTPPSPSERPNANLATALVHLPADGSPAVRLADMHPHGKWMHWWATSAAPREHHAGPGPARLRQ